MRNLNAVILGMAVPFFVASCSQQCNKHEESQQKDTITVVKQAHIETSQDAINELKSGNQRFLVNKLVNTNYKEEIEETKGGQKPHSVILSCMDSRVPPEIIFDQGIGHIFAIRVAGNIEDDNVIGSMEYAVEHSGAKLIVVMGHSHCGAVTGAVEGVKLGKLTQLVEQIKPAIKSDPKDPKTIDEAAKNNIQITISDILGKSEIIKEMVDQKKIAIVGAFYDIETGSVTFVE